MEVRLEIAEEGLKVLVAALQCLAQVGKELSLECDLLERKLTLRALNDARSASGQIELEKSFFAEPSDASVTLSGEPVTAAQLRTRFAGRSPFVKCKVFAKSCCNVFRTLKHVLGVQLAMLMDSEALQQADASQPTPSPSEDPDEVVLDCLELRWRLKCDFDITKTHHMKVQSCQILRPVFDKLASPSRWRTRQHHLSSLLTHIHHSSEVSVTCSATHVKFESYFGDLSSSKAQLQTETAVESAEFSEYVLQPAADSIDSTAQLIFCNKEIRALLAFCKASDVLEVSFFFSAGGNPVLFSAESTSMAKFAIEMTLSTITTYLPSSQSRSEEEVSLLNANGVSTSQATPLSQSAPTSQTPLSPSQTQSSQENPRYLTHSKRPRVD